MNILVITLSNFGDVILTTPVIMRLVRKFPQARLTVVVGPRAQGVLQRSPDIQKIVIYDKKASLWEKIRFILRLRKTKYDWVVDLRNTAIPFLVSCKKRTPLFRKFVKINMRERHLELLETLLSSSPDSGQNEEGVYPPFRFFNEADEVFTLWAVRTAKVLDERDWIVVAAGAGSARKRWPMRNFKEVIQELHKKTGKKIILVGLLGERLISDHIAEALPGSASVLCGDLTFAETAALISRASLLISNDSANMHLGFELGIPTVGIFGPTDHEQYGHEGPKFRIARGDAQNCTCQSQKIPPAERNCFHGLKPETVVKLSLELLNASPAV